VAVRVCAVHGDAVRSWTRRRVAGGGDRRHRTATQAGAQHADVDGEGGQETAQHARRRPQHFAVARSRQAQAPARRRHTGVDITSAARPWTQVRFDGSGLEGPACSGAP